MPRYIGKVCAQHPELKGERRNGNCPACQRERQRDPDYRAKYRALKKPEVHRRAVTKWRKTDRERFIAGKLARNAVRRARKKDATEGDSAEVRRAWIVLSQEAKRQGKVIDHIIPLAGCRVCGAKGPHEPSLGDLLRRERLLGVPQGRENDPRHFPTEGMVLWRHRPALDLLQLNRRVEDMNRCVDVVEVDHELAELVLGVLALAGDLCPLAKKPADCVLERL